TEGDAPPGRMLFDQKRGDEEAAQGEEDVHAEEAAVDQPRVIEHDGEDGDSADAVKGGVVAEPCRHGRRFGTVADGGWQDNDLHLARPSGAARENWATQPSSAKASKITGLGTSKTMRKRPISGASTKGTRPSLAFLSRAMASTTRAGASPTSRTGRPIVSSRRTWRARVPAEDRPWRSATHASSAIPCDTASTWE